MAEEKSPDAELWSPASTWKRLHGPGLAVQWSWSSRGGVAFVVRQEPAPGAMSCIDLDSGAVIASTPLEDEDPVTAIRVDQDPDAASDEPVVFTAHRSSLIRVWAGTQMELRSVMKTQHPGPVIVMYSNLRLSWFLTVAVGNDVSMKVWNLKERRCEHNLRSLVARPSYVLALTAETVLIASVEGHLWLWRRGKPHLQDLDKKHVSQITWMGREKDTLFTTGRDKFLCLWSLHDFSCYKVIPLFEEVEEAQVVLKSRLVKNCPDDDKSKLLLTAGSKGRLRGWEVATGREVELAKKVVNWTVPDLNITALAMAGSDAHELYFMQEDVITRRSLSNKKSCMNRCLHVLDTTDMILVQKNVLVVSNTSSLLHLYDLSQDPVSLHIKATPHNEQVLWLATNGDSETSRFASVGKERVIFVWECLKDNSGYEVTMIHKCPGHSANIRAIALLDQILFSADEDGIMKMWLLQEGKSALTAHGTSIAHEKEVTCLAASNSKQLVASGSLDKTVKIWDYRTLTLITTFSGHRRLILCLHLIDKDSNTSILVSGSGDGTVRLWDLNHRTCLKTIEGHSGQITRALLTFPSKSSVSKPVLISATADGNLYFWNVPLGLGVAAAPTEIGCYDGHEGQIWGLTVHDEQVVTAGSDGQIVFWEDRTEEVKRQKCEAYAKEIEESQTLSNLIKDGNLLKAFRLSLKTKRPRIAYSILKEASETPRGILPLLKGIDESLFPDLLHYTTQWNSNTKTYAVAQQIQRYLLTTGYFDKVRANTETKLAALAAYDLKHADRLGHLNRKFAIVESIFQ